MITIVSVGDIMPGGLLSESNQHCANKEILDLLMHGDIRCGTLECALGNEPSYDKNKVNDRGNVIYAKDTDIRRLKELHIDLVSLANNHFYDLGPEGASHTIELLDAKGILHCGAGRNLEEASRPVVKEVGNKKIAFLAFCDTNYNNVFYCTYATKNSPGVNPMDEKHVVQEIKKNAVLYDHVVVLAHWGTENTFKPNISTYRMANKMLKAGACLILGSHPHRVQRVIHMPKGSIAYSMGNFLFPERLIAPPKITYYPEKHIDYLTLPITDKYPIVECITLKTLPFLSRVGMIVETQIKTSTVISNYQLTYLNKDNSLSILEEENCKRVERKIRWISLLLKVRLYQPYMAACRSYRKLQKKLKSLLKI